MSSSEWEEVKRLAADFQRAQLTSTIQRLSERNCIEIVNRLQQLKSIDVFYTINGKEYITYPHLQKEIKDELYEHGGRINLVDLQEILNVDITHIESQANILARTDKNIHIVLGQLFNNDYLDRIAEEINDKLQESGQLSISELIKQYDLQSQFLNSVIQKRLGTLIQGKLDHHDQSIIYTDAFINLIKAKVRGAFSGTTRPTSIMSAVNNYSIPEQMIHGFLEELINSGYLHGCTIGSREKGAYIPHIYTKTQDDWVDNFYKQNGFLEYDQLSRIGITEPQAYIRKQFKSENLIYLSSCAAGQLIVDQIEAHIDEALSQDSWIDVMLYLPSVFSDDDGAQIIQTCLKGKLGVKVYCNSIITSENFIRSCAVPFDKLMQEKADKDCKKIGNILSDPGQKLLNDFGSGHGAGRKDKKDERKKKNMTTGTCKGGMGGREVKTKRTKDKRKGRKGDDGDDDDDFEPNKGNYNEIPFMNRTEIEFVLQQNLTEAEPDFITEIAEELIRPLTRAYQEIARSVFMQSSGNVSSTARKKAFTDLQDRMNTLWNNCHMFESSLQYFNDDTQTHLCRHLLKTVCTEMVNHSVNVLASDHMLSVVDPSTLTTEMRASIINQLPDQVRGPLTKLHMSLNGSKGLAEFYSSLETIVSASFLDIILKKVDKKKERQLLFNHRHALSEQLINETDPATVLHLVIVLLFQHQTHSMLLTPGRCVPQIIAELTKYLPPTDYHRLSDYQSLVVKQLTMCRDSANKNTAGEGIGSTEHDDKDIAKQLDDLLPDLKSMVDKKKQTTSTGPPSESN